MYEILSYRDAKKAGYNESYAQAILVKLYMLYTACRVVSRKNLTQRFL